MGMIADQQDVKRVNVIQSRGSKRSDGPRGFIDFPRGVAQGGQFLEPCRHCDAAAAQMLRAEFQHDRKFKEQCKAVHNFVDTYVQRRLRDGSSGKKSGTRKYVVLDAIVADVKDPQELRSQLLNILLAGSDTISGTLGFLLASLAQYPHIFKKLRNIIIDDFGSFDRPKQITLSGLKNCSYLQWCLNEVLRVYPSVPVNFREAVRDTTLPVGGGSDGTSPVFVPKGHLVAWEVRLCILS